MRDFCQLAIYKRGFFSDLGFPNTIDLHWNKMLPIFPSPGGMSLTKLAMAGNNLTGKSVTFFYSVALWYSHS
jgi:hypothetical protein